MPSFTSMIDSKYLRRETITPEKTVTIRAVVQESSEDDNGKMVLIWVMYFAEYEKGLWLNTGHKNTLDEIFQGKPSEQVVGEKIILWNNPSVEYKGKVTGGIRIRSFNKMYHNNEIIEHQPESVEFKIEKAAPVEVKK